MKKTATLLILISSLMFTACGHLSRSNARAQLEHERKPGDKNAYIQTGIVCQEIFEYDRVREDGITATLQHTGFLTVSPIKPHLWKVQLTDSGKHIADGDGYAHQTKGDCDQWQHTIPLAKFDKLEITGIVEEGAHARVDYAATFVLTPIEKLLRKRLADDPKLAHTLAPIPEYTPEDADRFIEYDTVIFEKYDDGWKPARQRP